MTLLCHYTSLWLNVGGRTSRRLHRNKPDGMQFTDESVGARTVYQLVAVAINL